MKIAKYVIGSLLLAGVMSLGAAQAKPMPADLADLPEAPDHSGTYREPGRPDILVHVFVHGPKPVALDALTCGLDDPASSSVVPAAGWKLGSQVVYNLNPSSVPSSVGASNLATMTANAFGDWASAVSNAVHFNAGSSTTVSRSAYDGLNVVAWGRTSGQALATTYIRSNTQTGAVVDVDTIMNKKFGWSWSTQANCADASTYDAENILTHELGHWMGLDDTYTSPFVNNTMYGYGAKGEVKKDTLTTGDINGARAIYN